MAENNELVTVFRSADASAMDDAQEIAEILSGQQIEATILDDDTPGVVAGTVEVRVPAAQVERAEQIIAAEPVEGDMADVDPSPQLDPVVVWEGPEMEAETVEGLLRSADIQPIRVGTPTIPVLAFQIQVARDQAEQARQLIQEALASGPAAAEEAGG